MNDKLVKIQGKLKAPKGQHNSFANYNYRSAEDILEAVKPLCHEEGLGICLSDEVVNIGRFNYVKARVFVTDGTDTAEVFAYAREEEVKKGMDAAQITGSASSYARKYALNGLFAIDDTKDADSQDNTNHASDAKPAYSNPESPASDKQKKLIAEKLATQGVSLETMNGYLIEEYGVDIPLTKEGAGFVIDELLGAKV